MAKVVIFSGAGISAESGISTFRDSDGLWENHRIEDVCSFDSLEKNRNLVLEFYDQRRTQLGSVSSNKAHISIAQLQNKYPNDVAVITQNVDDLFERAGCKDTIHLHGFLPNIRCESCHHQEYIGYTPQDPHLSCPLCDSLMRPDIVFFGESAPMYKVLMEHINDCEILAVIGTSGAVVQTDYFAGYVPYAILNNIEPSQYINDTLYSEVYYAPATKTIDTIIEKIIEKLET